MWYVYTHTRKDTGKICYYGCGTDRRAWQRRVPGSLHETFRCKGLLIVKLVRFFDDKASARAYETALILRARARGAVLFNKVASGSEHAMNSFTNKLGAHAMSKEQKRAAWEKGAGKLRATDFGWWHHPDTKETKRAAECPEGGFIKGRGSFSWSTRP